MKKQKKADPIEKLGIVVASEFGELRTWLSRQFENISNKFERVETRLEHLETDSRDVKEGLRRVEHDTGEIKDELRAVSRAVDKDAETIVEFDRRIKKLEHAR